MMIPISQRSCRTQPLRSTARLIQHRTVPSRPFSITLQQQSHIGSAPIPIPLDVTFTIAEPPPPAADARNARREPTPIATIKGPLGELSMPIPPYLRVDHDKASGKATLTVLDRKEKKQKAMWGTTRAYLANHVLGVSEGHSCILRLVGVGYRASVEKTAETQSPEYEGQQFVSLKVGYSHPIELGIPYGVKVSTPQPTRVLIEGCEKEVVKQFAARIRKWRVPEPYKGKGIFVDDETIRLKNKKIK